MPQNAEIRLSRLNAHGFTLLEVLVALSIFAIIGLGSHQLLSTVIRAKDATENSTKELVELQRAMMLLERDLTQIIDRPIRGAYGDPLPSLMVATGDYDIEFSRGGWRNPRQFNRSDIQRVAWLLNQDVLERHYWHVLDRAEDSEPQVQKVIEGVRDFRVSLLDDDNEATSSWGLDASLQEPTEQPQPSLPRAIEILLVTESIGELRKLVILVEAPEQRQTQNPSGQEGTGDGLQDADEETEKAELNL